MGQQRTLWDNRGLYGTIEDYMGQQRTLWDNRGLYGTLEDLMEH